MTISVELHSDVRKDGRSLIQIRISDRGRRYRISSEIYVKKNQFKKGAKFGQWIIKHLDADRLNKALKSKITSIEHTYQSGEEVTPRQALMADSFFPFAEEFIEKYNNEAQMGTYESYKAKISKLKAYAGRGLKFSEITVRFIREYSDYLKKDRGNSINTIAVDLRKIRAIIRQAIREDLFPMDKNPFFKISIETKRTGKEKLTIEELEALRNVHLGETEYKFHARNIFLFCINLMGMRIGSALRIKPGQIQDGILHYQMNKTGKTKNIHLTEEALRIAEFYRTKYAGEKYLFPYLNDCESEYVKAKSATSLINKALKEIGEMAGIEKKITSHLARHSFTKLAIDAGTDMRTLQGMLDHSTVKITEDYAGDISDKAGNEALKKIFK